MNPTQSPQRTPMEVRDFVTAIKAAHLTGITFTLVPKRNGHGLDAAATLATPKDPRGIRLGIQHDIDGQLRASYGTEPSQPLPDIDAATLARVRAALDSLERIRTAAENLYRTRMQGEGVRLAAEYTERLMAARAAGDTTFDVLAELPREDLLKSGMRTAADLNALAVLHT